MTLDTRARRRRSDRSWQAVGNRLREVAPPSVGRGLTRAVVGLGGPGDFATTALLASDAEPAGEPELPSAAAPRGTRARKPTA